MYDNYEKWERGSGKMYVIDKLQKMYDVEGKTQLDGELAFYFLKHLKEMKTMNLQKCMQETGISKASIHRFYNKAGFQNFKDMINEIMKEYALLSISQYSSFSENNFSWLFKDSQLINLSQCLLKSENVYFYGCHQDIESLSSTINILRKNGIVVRELLVWNQTELLESLHYLNQNDVLIIIDVFKKIQMFHEASINQSDMLKISDLQQLSCFQYYIGEASQDEYHGFQIVQINNQKNAPRPFVLALLDTKLSHLIFQGEQV